MVPEIARDFMFDLGFQEHQHESEPCVDQDFPVPDRDRSVHAGAFEVDEVAIPLIVDVEFAGQVTSQLVRCGLSLLAGKLVSSMDVDMGHEAKTGQQVRTSLDAPRWLHQHPLWSRGG